MQYLTDFHHPPPCFNQTSYAKVFLHCRAIYNSYFCFMFPHRYTDIFLVWTPCPFLIPICSQTAGCSSHVHNSALNLLVHCAEKSPLALQEKRAHVFVPSTAIQCQALTASAFHQHCVQSVLPKPCPLSVPPDQGCFG